MSRVETESSPISRGSQSGERDLWPKRFTERVSFEFRVQSEGVKGEESGAEKDGLR